MQTNFITDTSKECMESVQEAVTTQNIVSTIAYQARLNILKIYLLDDFMVNQSASHFHKINKAQHTQCTTQ